MSTDPQQRFLSPRERVADDVGLALLKAANDFGEGDQIAGNLYVLRDAVMAVVDPAREQFLAEMDALKDDALFVARSAEENAWPDSDVAIKARRLIAALAVPESTDNHADDCSSRVRIVGPCDRTPDAPKGGED